MVLVDMEGKVVAEVNVTKALKSAGTGTPVDAPTTAHANASTSVPSAMVSTKSRDAPAPPSDPWLPAGIADGELGDRPWPPAGSTDFTVFARSAFSNDVGWPAEPDDETDLVTPQTDSFLPRFLRGYGWKPSSPTSSVTAHYTEIDSPLPRPPDYEFKNATAVDTIMRHPHLFKVSTEIRTDRLREMLKNHPNPAFVESVVTALEEGAWPWADTKHADGFPITWDNSKILPKTEREREFLDTQSHEEEVLGRYSPAFGPDLLPGMYSTPVLAVPKSRSTKLRLCSHMSAGQFCQNNMVDRSQVKGARLDTLHNFIAALLKYRRSNPDKRLVAFKSDVSSAFRLIPSHPLWQIKQVVTTNYPTRGDIANGVDRGQLVRHVD
ncbi:hypothetical protein C8F04DRAFT_1256145 [Mycena alexandri]|uniref:Uncharacterized protein n=1 Tax=Mycena alexandri TaxID=1745969 RepID=A0AAD6T2P2_9AGAR|nr:hypothetical protein C8F04DRAFT_1256145 [Mycena alexandri]